MGRHISLPSFMSTMLSKARWRTCHTLRVAKLLLGQCPRCPVNRRRAAPPRDAGGFFSISLPLMCPRVFTHIHGTKCKYTRPEKHTTCWGTNVANKETEKDLYERTLEELHSAGFCWSWQWWPDGFWPRRTLHRESRLPASHWTTTRIQLTNTNEFSISYLLTRHFHLLLEKRWVVE